MTLNNRASFDYISGVDKLARISPCHEPRLFTLAEANLLLPLLRSITGRAHQALQAACNRTSDPESIAARSQLQKTTCQNIVKQWVAKMERLGIVVKGLWLLDFDTGDGYLCWKYPDVAILHYHEYDERFSQRRYLQEVIREISPVWATTSCNNQPLPD